MKYFDTPVEEQETTINISYDEEIVQVYTNRIDVIKNLTKTIGKPSKRDKKGKSYWMGATWNIPFKEISLITSVLNKEVFIDKNKTLGYLSQNLALGFNLTPHPKQYFSVFVFSEPKGPLGLTEIVLSN